MLDPGIWGAFLAGLASFLTPCILPMVPFYLGYLAGSNINMLEAGNDSAITRRAVVNSIAFALGVITIFMLLGLSSSFLGSLFGQYMGVLRIIAGGIIILLGLHFLGVFRIGFLMQEARFQGPKDASNIFGAYVIGLAFAFGWTACVGPILASILFVAASSGDTWRGVILLFAYGVGMTLPFVLAAIFVSPFMRFYKKFRNYFEVFEKVIGVLMIIFGILIMTNKMNYIANWMIQAFPAFQSMG